MTAANGDILRFVATSRQSALAASKAIDHAAALVADYVAAHKPYGFTASKAENATGTLRVYWKGAVPSDLVTVLKGDERAAPARFTSAPRSEAEIMAALEAIAPADPSKSGVLALLEPHGITITSIGPEIDASSLMVSAWKRDGAELSAAEVALVKAAVATATDIPCSVETAPPAQPLTDVVKVKAPGPTDGRVPPG